MLLFIPLFNYIIYPVLAKINLLQTSLQRIGVGFFMAALSFGVSGVIDLQLEVRVFILFHLQANYLPSKTDIIKKVFNRLKKMASSVFCGSYLNTY